MAKWFYSSTLTTEFRFQTATNTILTVCKSEQQPAATTAASLATATGSSTTAPPSPPPATDDGDHGNGVKQVGIHCNTGFLDWLTMTTKVTGSSSSPAWFWRIRHKWRWRTRICFVRVFTRMSSSSATGIQSAFYEIIPRLLGDPSGCSLGFVDNNTKAMFQYMLLILKHIFCFDVNNTKGTTWMVTLYMNFGGSRL